MFNNKFALVIGLPLAISSTSVLASAAGVIATHTGIITHKSNTVPLKQVISKDKEEAWVSNANASVSCEKLKRVLTNSEKQYILMDEKRLELTSEVAQEKDLYLQKKIASTLVEQIDAMDNLSKFSNNVKNRKLILCNP